MSMVAISYENRGQVKANDLEYFFMMGKSEREKVANWLKNLVPTTDNQKKFVSRIQKALSVVDYDYKIATIEPSFGKAGVIYYSEGDVVARGGSLKTWKEKAEAFYHDKTWNSGLARLEEGDLFKAYRIAMGYWSMEYVCDDSSSDGNYWNAPHAAHCFEDSGAKKVGGFADGVGNTRGIYQVTDGFALVGGCYVDGVEHPMAYAYYDENEHRCYTSACGVVVIRKVGKE